MNEDGENIKKDDDEDSCIVKKSWRPTKKERIHCRLYFVLTGETQVIPSATRVKLRLSRSHGCSCLKCFHLALTLGLKWLYATCSIHTVDYITIVFDEF